LGTAQPRTEEVGGALDADRLDLGSGPRMERDELGVFVKLELPNDLLSERAAAEDAILRLVELFGRPIAAHLIGHILDRGAHRPRRIRIVFERGDGLVNLRLMVAIKERRETDCEGRHDDQPELPPEKPDEVEEIAAIELGAIGLVLLAHRWVVRSAGENLTDALLSIGHPSDDRLGFFFSGGSIAAQF